MTISFSYYETLVFIHRHLVEIISFLSLGVIVMAIILIVNSYHKRKASLSAKKMQGYKIFSPQEQDAAFVDHARSAVVSECAEKNGVFAILGVEGTELGEVFSEQCVSLCLGELYASAVWFARLDLMTVADIGPMLRFMESFKFFDYLDCPLKERQLHYRPLCGEGRRSDREGHYRHEEYQDSFHKPTGVMVPGLIGVMMPGVLPPLSSPLSLLLNSKRLSNKFGQSLFIV